MSTDPVDFILESEQNLRIAHAVAEAWPQVHKWVTDRLNERLRERLLSELPDWKFEPFGAVVRDRWAGVWIWKPRGERNRDENETGTCSVFVLPVRRWPRFRPAFRSGEPPAPASRRGGRFAVALTKASDAARSGEVMDRARGGGVTVRRLVKCAAPPGSVSRSALAQLLRNRRKS